MSDSQVVLPEPSKEVRQWAMLCHLSAFAGMFFPLGNLLGPLLVWQFKRKTHPLIDDQGKEALNFQIMVALVWAVGMVVGGVLLGAALMTILLIVAVVLVIIAALKANKGIAYRYPWIWRLIK